MTNPKSTEQPNSFKPMTRNEKLQSSPEQRPAQREGEPILSVRHLSKTVRGRALVSDVSFDVRPGQVFGFLGPNGAGKTTTIRMLVGLIRPTGGDVLIGGYHIRSHPLEAMRQVGCIVENPDLYPYLSGRENLLQLARMQGTEAVERISDIARLVHLHERLDDKVRTYSLGMRQRLGIAQALLGNPRLLILDEPTNGLDPAGIRELRTFLQGLAKQGLAVFISSHLLSEVELLCDHVALTQSGRVIQTGAIATLLTEVSNEVTFRAEPMDKVKTVLANVLQSYVGQSDDREGTFSSGQANGHVSPFVSRGISITESPTGQLSCSMTDEMVAATVAELERAGCQIYEVIRHRVSLEDFFLQTTELKTVEP